MAELKQTWDLDVIFPGGSSSEAFAAFLQALAEDLARFPSLVQRLNTEASNETWTDAVKTAQDLSARLREAGAFVGCLTAQDVRDDKAKQLQAQVSGLQAQLASAYTQFDAALAAVPEARWAELMALPALAEVRFALEERRRRTQDRLDPPREALIAQLGVDGYHAWGELYNVVVGRMTMEVEAEGRRHTLSMGQAANWLEHPDRRVRQAVFARWEETWAAEAELCARALNHLGGFRLAAYRARGWEDVLKEPLDVNRMRRETLEAMWDAVVRHKGPLVQYLQRKAKLIGVDAPAWFDVEAPIGRSDKRYTYDEAADFIETQFRSFDPEFASFARSCFEKRWIEAEDRPGKRPGGFCTSFPVSEQTRVFVTFSGSSGNVSTIAHELGHAYHQHVMRGLPMFAQQYAMNVAETASTFAEQLVSDAALAQAGSDEERIGLLDERLQRAVAMFMNIHARFLFETRYYAQRRHGFVAVPALNDLMVEAQREAYQNALASYHPHFWASKLHFYITGTPFYNFPYTFGYLFSSGIYARAKAEGPSFAARYRSLLRDTASMTVEDLAQKHLGVDLTKPDFWDEAARFAVADVETFLRLTGAV
ncbi:MAG: M3 family oligoendopeptidase [Thermoflavifilum sp.]|nr:M3 family oligoendopeptidase [Thermoflavifilum sp.]MCL6513843.1 M3 family oligoendopeptidase [Alicyclobacillus sp.]